ncbi:ATP synthase subunit b, mitochondrial [Bombus vancouverensis nearcticus]|uniref:ATP synthase subunit b, mitochondrial n=1 Tax=Bombus vancouverensis nearcticus TaxID=2705178 RepID=UPI00143C00AC|nr:ATP synthase subunit b, mitochondrial [Bombus vancouverensis nearcticus]
MLSRLNIRNISSQLKTVASCGIQTTAVASCNVPRPKRPIEPAPVRFGFIPDEWFRFFYPKTGATGPYVFLTTFSTYLLSKEWYILEHEYYGGICLLSIILYVSYKLGPKVATFLDKKVDEVEDNLNLSNNEIIEEQKAAIDNLEKEKWRTEGQLMIYDAKKQNIMMQLEASYRENLATVYTEVKKILDYHAQIDNIDRRIAQKHMVQWITNSVLKSITPEQEKANLLQCIKDLQSLSAKA